MVTWSQSSPYPKQHFDQRGHFVRLMVVTFRHTHTDHETSVIITMPCSHALHVMQPNNNNIKHNLQQLSTSLGNNTSTLTESEGIWEKT